MKNKRNIVGKNIKYDKNLKFQPLIYNLDGTYMTMVSVKKPESIWKTKFAEQSRKRIYLKK